MTIIQACEDSCTFGIIWTGLINKLTKTVRGSVECPIVGFHSFLVWFGCKDDAQWSALLDDNVESLVSVLVAVQ